MAWIANQFDSGPLLPAGSRDYLSRRLSEVAGLVLVAASLALGAALASYSPADPSLNSAASGSVQNWLGRPGALGAMSGAQTWLPPCMVARGHGANGNFIIVHDGNHFKTACRLAVGGTHGRRRRTGAA